MKWYEGNIAEAVTLSRKNGSIFVVFVDGENDISNKLMELINNDQVTQTLETQHFVAIRISSTSVSYQQFSEIYKQPPIPSLYFIGKTGTPIEIIVDANNSDEVLNKIKQILEKHGVNWENLKLSNASTSTNLIQAEMASEVASGDLETKIPQKPTTSNATSTDTTIPDNEQQVNSEEKVQHAKDLIEKKRAAKKAEEEEKERQQEIERRKAGQSVQNFKKWQQDQELKQLMEQRDKEKKEQQAARQRILAQIEQDKADRAAKFPSNQQTPSTSANTTSSPTAPRKSPQTSTTAKLQFKLPDGSSHMHDFAREKTLQDVREYIKENLNLQFNNFTLSTTFPRREFTQEDHSRTMLELELVPNAVILILPLAHGAVTTNPGNFFNLLLWSFITPILNMFGYIRNYLTGNRVSRDQTSATTSNNGQGGKRSADTRGHEGPSSQAKKRPGDSTTVIRRQGNVHRLTDKTDSEDENNTWNGNSTQQM